MSMSKATSLSRTPGGKAFGFLVFFFFLCLGLGAPSTSAGCAGGGGCVVDDDDDDDDDDEGGIAGAGVVGCFGCGCCDEVDWKRVSVCCCDAVDVETSMSPEFSGSGIGTRLLQRLCTLYLHLLQ